MDGWTELNSGESPASSLYGVVYGEATYQLEGAANSGKCGLAEEPDTIPVPLQAHLSRSSGPHFTDHVLPKLGNFQIITDARTIEGISEPIRYIDESLHEKQILNCEYMFADTSAESIRQPAETNNIRPHSFGHFAGKNPNHDEDRELARLHEDVRSGKPSLVSMKSFDSTTLIKSWVNDKMEYRARGKANTYKTPTVALMGLHAPCNNQYSCSTGSIKDGEENTQLKPNNNITKEILPRIIKAPYAGQTIQWPDECQGYTSKSELEELQANINFFGPLKSTRDSSLTDHLSIHSRLIFPFGPPEEDLNCNILSNEPFYLNTMGTEPEHFHSRKTASTNDLKVEADEYIPTSELSRVKYGYSVSFKFLPGKVTVRKTSQAIAGNQVSSKKRVLNRNSHGGVAQAPALRGFVGQFRITLPHEFRQTQQFHRGAKFGSPFHPNGELVNTAFASNPRHEDKDFTMDNFGDNVLFTVIRQADEMLEEAASHSITALRSSSKENLRKECHRECSAARLEGVPVGTYRYYQGHLTVEEYKEAKICVCWENCFCNKFCTLYGDLICPCSDAIVLEQG